MKINAVNNMHQAQYTLNRLLIAFAGFLVIAFSGSAYSETKKASKTPPPAEVKEMPALTPEYKKQLRSELYETIKNNSKNSASNSEMSDDAKELWYGCVSGKLIETLWDSADFKATRSFAVLKDETATKNVLEYCQLLMLTNEVAKQVPENKPLKSMAFNDLYLDYNGLKGSTVRVKGFLIASGDTNIITEGRGKFTAIFVDMVNLSREERKRVLDQCASGCDVELEGVVNNVMFQKGLTATKLY